MTNNIISIRNLKKLFKNKNNIFGKPINYVHAIDKIDLCIEEGITFGLVGESGCGKTTLANVILGIEKPTTGEVKFQDMNISEMSRKDKFNNNIYQKIQIVAQNPSQVLSPRKSIGFLIAEPMLVNNLYKNLNKAKPKVFELLDRVNLVKELFNRLPHQLSGGQQQRVCIARALSLNPKLIILDEPTSSLDISVQAKILNLLNKLQKEEGLTYILITHDIRVAEYLCHKIAVMYLGEIVEIINVEDFSEKAKHPYSKLLIYSSYANSNYRDNDISIIAELPSPVNLPKGCRFKNRCNKATDICFKEHPKLIELKDGTKCRCHVINKNNKEANHEKGLDKRY